MIDGPPARGIRLSACSCAPSLNLSAVPLPHRLFQLLNVVNHWSDVQTERARVYTLLVLAAAALGAASTVALPVRFYLRHRCAALRRMGRCFIPAY